MNLIKKLIFSLRLVSCTVKSLFGRITAVSTLGESLEQGIGAGDAHPMPELHHSEAMPQT